MDAWDYDIQDVFAEHTRIGSRTAFLVAVGTSVSNPVRQAAATKLIATRGSRCGVAPRGAADTVRGEGGPNWGLWRCNCGVFGPLDALSGPLDCGGRPAVCLNQRDMIPQHATQLPLATALDWDGHVRSPCGASPLYREPSGTLETARARPTLWDRDPHDLGLDSRWCQCGSGIDLRLCSEMCNARTRVHILIDCLPQFEEFPRAPQQLFEHIEGLDCSPQRPTVSTMRKLEATPTFSTHRFSQATSLKSARPKMNCA